MMVAERCARQPSTRMPCRACPVQRLVRAADACAGTAAEAQPRPSRFDPPHRAPGAGAWRATRCTVAMRGPSSQRAGAVGSWRDRLVEHRCQLLYRPEALLLPPAMRLIQNQLSLLLVSR
jgi:hypothetical protein